jgi:hypothetical protein
LRQKTRARTICPGNTKGGSIIVLLTSCLTGLDKSVLQIKTKIVSSHTADPKPVKQEVNGTVILPPLVFPDLPQQPTLNKRTADVVVSSSVTRLGNFSMIGLFLEAHYGFFKLK